MNAGKSYRTTQDIGETKWCSNSPMLRIGYLKKWFAVLARVEDRRKGFNIAWTRTILKILVRSSNPRTFRKYNQSCIARQCIVTRRFHRFFYHVGNGNNLGQRGIMVWLQEESFSKQADKLCSSPLWIRWIIKMASWETLCDLSQTRIAPYRNTWKYFQDTLFLVQLEARPTKRTAILSNKIKRSHSLRHTACRVHWESDAQWRPRISFIKGKAWFFDRVLFLELIRKLVHKIYLYKKQDHLGKDRNKMRRATRKPEATLLTSEYLVYRAQRWNCTMHGDKITSQSWLRCSKNNSIRNISLKTWVISRRSTGSSQKYSKIWAPQFLKLFENSAKHQRLHCFSVTEIGFLCCSCVFTSILGFVIKKNSSRGPKHGQSERQIMFLQGEEDAQESETVKARPTWKILLKDVDLGEPTSFLDHVHLCWLHSTRMSDQQGYCGQLQKCFSNQGFLLGLLKNPETKATVKPDAETISSWFFEIWKVMQRNAWRYCEFANKTIEQCFKSQRHAWKIINSKKKKMDQL